jgi:hypothetical protein
MLSTKVVLNFPPESQIKSMKVEISRLLPVTDIKSISSREVHAAEIHAANLTVAEHPEFKRAQVVMKNKSQQQKGADDAPVNIESTSDADADAEVEDALRFVEVEEGIFVAITELSFQSNDGGNSYEIEKLRKKRLRLYNIGSPDVEGVDLKACNEDPWFQRLKSV